MEKVFCIKQRSLVCDGTAEMWSYRVFNCDNLEEYEDLQMSALTDPCPSWVGDEDYEEESPLEWYERYKSISRQHNMQLYEFEAPSFEAVAAILQHYYNFIVVKFIY